MTHIDRLATRVSSDKRRAAALAEFVRRYARPAQAGSDPNDRRFDRSIQARIKRMDPVRLDALLRDGDE